jgi:hypothetical protein
MAFDAFASVEEHGLTQVSAVGAISVISGTALRHGSRFLCCDMDTPDDRF